MGSTRAQNDPSVRTRLTRRQRQVLALMASGATNGEIAEKLGLSLEGAKWHVREIFGRLGVDSREEAVAWWQAQGPPGRLAWSPIAVFGAAAATGIAIVGFAIAIAVLAIDGDSEPARGDSPTSTPSSIPTADSTPTPVTLRITPVALKPQPPLREAATGNRWRLLLADDGLGLPPRSERILAVAYDGEPRRVDVLGADGRVAARVETGYEPMARLNPVTGALLISDWSGLTDADIRPARLLVLDLEGARPLGEIKFAEQRLDFTVTGNAVYVSADGRWFYWIAHGLVCSGDEAACDSMVFHAVDLVSVEASLLRAPMPVGCGIPQLVAQDGSGLLFRCPKAGSTTWRIDAAGPLAQVVAVQSLDRTVSWVGSRAGDVILEPGYTNDGSLTGLTLWDATTAVVRAQWPLTDTWGAYLLDERTALLLRSDGRLERVDLLTGIGQQLPYAIDPGNQGLDIRFYR